MGHGIYVVTKAIIDTVKAASASKIDRNGHTGLCLAARFNATLSRRDFCNSFPRALMTCIHDVDTLTIDHTFV